MSLAEVSLLFLLQTALGSLLTFAISDRPALGPKYFKFGGWVLLGLYGLAGTLVWGPALAPGASGASRALGLSVGVAASSLLMFASVSGWKRPWLEGVLLWLGIAASAAALSLAVAFTGPGAGARAGLALTLPLVAALAGALVLGFTTWSMILGHWYLVSHGLSIQHLARLVRPLPWLLLLKAAVSGFALWLLWPAFLGAGNASQSELLAHQPERVLDVVNVWARIPVGLLVPAVLAWMTLVTVRMEKTQPATGILYAMCVLVYLGELMGRMVEGATGLPL
ncbi:MAG TPA: hypothetical protein VFY71_11515 [Planctomycetota bacterium]|nr:hypothetical protein [Planctomycetota bacterium]